MNTLSREAAAATAAETAHRSVPDAFRAFMGAFFTSVAVITSAGRDDRPHGLTCNSLTSVTLAPPTLLVCLNAKSGTLAAVQERGSFVVNLLHGAARGTAELFASHRPDRFFHVAWRPSPRRGLPSLAEDAFATAECDVVETKLVGDHVVVFGRVVETTSLGGQPLLYGRRRYAEVRP